jgi:hypothetical protein
MYSAWISWGTKSSTDMHEKCHGFIKEAWCKTRCHTCFHAIRWASESIGDDTGPPLASDF